MRKKPRIILVLTLIVLLFLSVFFGSYPPSPVYIIKIFRESCQSLFIFGNEDKTNWFLTLSDKRVSEAEKLDNLKFGFLARIQLEKAREYQLQAKGILLTLKDKVNTTYLEDKLSKNNEKIEILTQDLDSGF